MHSILQQALQYHHNEYFSLSEEEQTLFKLQEHDGLDEKIKIFIEDKLGMPHGEREASHEQVFEYNKINLPYIGIGPNSFMLNEFNWNEKVLRFKNLYEANADNHDFQEQSASLDKDYVPKPLYNRINDWARAFVDDEFYYLSLFNYAIWLYYDMEELSFAWFDENIPYDFVSGKDDGKEVDGGFLWDKEIDAGGLECWYQHMTEFSRKWINNYYNIDNATKSRFGDFVYIIDHDGLVHDDPCDPTLAYVFSSLEVLKNITYQDFVNDCEKVKGDPTELFELRKSRRVEFKLALDEEFVSIKKTHPPGLIEHTKSIQDDIGIVDNLEE